MACEYQIALLRGPTTKIFQDNTSFQEDVHIDIDIDSAPPSINKASAERVQTGSALNSPFSPGLRQLTLERTPYISVPIDVS